ncbi:MAG: extracellular catalytic domain type 1 short-chain-length polyhydroxyalkanoate depolymerase [Paracoccaceae bacterium]
MKHSFARGMSRATDLTRAGKLDEATALIQSLLKGAPAPAADTAGTGDDAIEGSFTRLDEPVAALKASPVATATRRARKRLGATLRDIAAAGMPNTHSRTPAATDLPQNAQFLSLTHSSAQGSRDYRLYVPAILPAGPVPLIVMMHGCTQSPEDFANGTGMNQLAEEFGVLIAWPAQTNGANMQKCWNWFRPEDQVRDRGEPGVIAGIVTDILASHEVDPARIYIAGLSAGGAIAAIMGAAYPEVFAAIGVHSGLPVGAARDMPSAFSAMRSGAEGSALGKSIPAIVFHGLADSTVHPSNGDAVITQSLGPRPGTKRARLDGVSEGGRNYRLTRHSLPNGNSKAEHWEIDGAGHAWSGGQSSGSYTDPKGPDASREMVRFFLQHKQD